MSENSGLLEKVEIGQNPSKEKAKKLKKDLSLRYAVESLSDPSSKLRAEHLIERKKHYQCTVKIWPELENILKIDPILPSLPPHNQLFSFTDETSFNVSDYLEIGKLVALEKVNTTVSHMVKKITTLELGKDKSELEKIPTLDELRKFLPEEYGRKLSKIIDIKPHDKWLIDDSQYALDRLTGINPMLIEKCKKDPIVWPHDITSSEKKIKENLEKYLEEGRLFMCDYSLIEGLTLYQGRTLEAPIAVFVQKEKFEPFCIQIRKGERVICPEDDKSPNGPIWYLAKTHVAAADNHYQQFASHVVPTHFAMETFLLASKRNMSPVHPISILLSPHFKKLLSINFLARTILLGKNQMVDMSMSTGRNGGVQLAGRFFVKKWTFQNSMLHNDIEMRGVTAKDLPFFPYRDDALLWENAISRFVTGIISVYYGNTAELQKVAIEKDFELQHFVAEANKEFSKTHPKHGIPEKIQSGKELVDFLTNIISHCSYHHALMNYASEHHYCFPPNAPATLRQFFPKGRDFNVTWKLIIDTLPDYKSALRQTGMARQLAMCPQGYNTFGKADLFTKYRFKNFNSKMFVEKFGQEIAEISKVISEREKERKKIDGFGYPWLSPDKVTFAIEL